jgi:UDP-galactopyranose mutase
MKIPSTASDLVVFSHLRWDFVFQRPQHLLTRCARERRVYFVEEPLFEHGIAPTLDITPRGDRLHVAVPRLPAGSSESETVAHLERLVAGLMADQVSPRYIAWYYTPMALKFTRALKAETIVYDCMDELSNFKNAPQDIVAVENELFRLADVVFTGGVSLYEHKCDKHPNIHPFPSSVDVAHFGKARTKQIEPDDQRSIAHPRIGYAGVIDERFDIELIRGVAQARPDWQLVMIGPVVKIDPASLPRAPNIHYLGSKSYEELPRYLSGWDVALLPFARNDSTRFISPTKTPEYLAAGRRVVSTSIRDVVRTYGERGLARIADEPQACVAAIEASLAARADDGRWLASVDEFLSRMSWDETYRAMWHLIEAAAGERAGRRRRVMARPTLPTLPAAAPAPIFAAGEVAASQSG